MNCLTDINIIRYNLNPCAFSVNSQSQPCDFGTLSNSINHYYIIAIQSFTFVSCILFFLLAARSHREVIVSSAHDESTQQAGRKREKSVQKLIGSGDYFLWQTQNICNRDGVLGRIGLCGKFNQAIIHQLVKQVQLRIQRVFIGSGKFF